MKSCSSLDVTFSRRMLSMMHADVRAAFPDIRVSDASVLDSGCGQYLFELEYRGERFAEYVSASNAYEARYEGWCRFLGAKRVAGWCEP